MIDKYNEAGISALEYKNRAVPTSTSAKPISECVYPKCEECDHYHGHWCTVPVVVSKQNFILINDKIDDLMKRVLDLENLVDEEILKPKPQITTTPAETNYTWADYFDKEQE